jgi:putative glutamine amidotransferase
MSLPMIGVICCHWQIKDERYFHLASDQYVDAVRVGAGGFPLLIPALQDNLPISQLLGALDGLLFTGSPSNIEPYHYGGLPLDNDFNDPIRDATTLPLIRAAVAQGVPVLGICRGFQEMNVAFGGSLYQKVHEQPQMLDHRDIGNTADEKYCRIAHPIHFAEHGLLQQWTGKTDAMVNSLHHQGVQELASQLKVEASAPDGLVEAFSVTNAPSFSFAVQWHPEWRHQENPLSQAIFQAFGRACREHHATRHGLSTHGLESQL